MWFHRVCLSVYVCARKRFVGQRQLIDKRQQQYGVWEDLQRHSEEKIMNSLNCIAAELLTMKSFGNRSENHRPVDDIWESHTLHYTFPNGRWALNGIDARTQAKVEMSPAKPAQTSPKVHFIWKFSSSPLLCILSFLIPEMAALIHSRPANSNVAFHVEARKPFHSINILKCHLFCLYTNAWTKWLLYNYEWNGNSPVPSPSFGGERMRSFFHP